MNPIYPLPSTIPLYYSDPTQNFTAFPAHLLNISDAGDKLLDRLDSDTKEYVLNHTSSDRTSTDIINCINGLNTK